MGREPKEKTLAGHPLFKNLAVPNKRHGAASPMTMSTYHMRLVRLEEISGRKLDDALLHPKAAYDAISKEYTKSATTRKGVLTAVMALFAHSPAYAKRHPKQHLAWSLLHRMQCGIEAKAREDNRITPEKRKAMITISALERAALKLKKSGLDTLEKSMDFLLLSFMTDIPPKRLDLGELLVCKGDKPPAKYDGNYVLVPAGKAPCTLVLRQYKTARVYGVIKDDLPFSAALKESLKRFPRDHVFEPPMSPEKYGKFIRTVCERHTKKAAGINDIRHAYISERCIASKVIYADLSKIAHSMGHSVDMQARYQLVGF